MTAALTTTASGDVTLSSLKSGEAAHVVALDSQHPLRRRLLELGFIRGAKVAVVRLAPMGDPVHLRLGNTDLALRAADLVGVTVRHS